MPGITKDVLFDELKRAYRELDFQRDVGNACEPWEIAILGLLIKHKENLWDTELELRKQMKRVESQGFHQGMIHQVREILGRLGLASEEVASFERGLLGLVETFPGSNVFVPADKVENYREP